MAWVNNNSLILTYNPVFVAEWRFSVWGGNLNELQVKL